MATPTLIKVTETAVSLNPVLSTPYPQSTDCALTYRNPGGTLLAWDVVYGLSFSSEARTCHPPEVTDWWFQTESTATYAAFGPTFECPQLYNAVHTAVISGNDADVQEVFCCPPSFSLHALQPVKFSFPSQCITTATSGQVLSFLDLDREDGTLVSTMMTSTVDDDEITIFGQPVNGFNVAAPTGSDPGTDGDSSDPDTDGDSSEGDGENKGDNGTPLAVSVGVSVGVVVGLALIALGVWLLWRRRKRIKGVTHAFKPEGSDSHGDRSMQEQLSRQPPEELQAHQAGAELPGDGVQHELHAEESRAVDKK